MPGKENILILPSISVTIIWILHFWNYLSILVLWTILFLSFNFDTFSSYQYPSSSNEKITMTRQKQTSVLEVRTGSIIGHLHHVRLPHCSLIFCLSELPVEEFPKCLYGQFATVKSGRKWSWVMENVDWIKF